MPRNRNLPNHDLIYAQRPGRWFPWDSNTLISCITTTGPQATKLSHFSGRRAFTDREFARFQGFPWDYEFKGGKALKQIGNSFSPMIAQIILTSVRKHLETRDKAEIDAIARERRR
jgi:site-specific DNA-cytosine methylase